MNEEEQKRPLERVWRQRLMASFLVAIMVLAGLTALVVIGSRPAAAAPFRSLRIGVGDDALQISTTNPLKMTLLYEYVVVYNVYSTLVTFDKNYQIVGDLAYDWSLGSDNVTWTFHLVQGAYFTNPANPSDRSHPVTADDVVFTYNMLRAASGTLYDDYVANISAVNKVDATTVEIVFDGPFAAYYSVFTAVPILPQYIWSGVGNVVNYKNDPPIGSGAVYLDKTNSTLPTTVVLRRNPNYYADAYYCRVVRPNEIRYISYTTSGSMVNDFLNVGNLDIIDHIAPSDFVGALSNPDWSPKWHVNSGFVGELSINVMTSLIRQSYQQFRPGTNNPILLDYTVRKAIAMSINKTALVEDALRGFGAPADSLIPNVNPWHYDIPAANQFKFDTAAARALLNAAGWTYNSAGTLDPAATPLYKQGRTDPLIFRFYTLNTATQWELAAQDIVAWLRQTGIQTTDRLNNPTPGYGLYSVNQMSGYWYQGDYDIWLWDWIFSAYSDPSIDVMSVETTQEIGNNADNYYSNTSYDNLYYQSLQTIDPVARRAITNEMQRMVYEYASYILPYYREDLYAANAVRAWTGFGDWNQNTALIDDSDLPILFQEISPLDNLAPAISGISPVQWVNGSAAPISVAASDPEGGALTYTWDFGDGTAPATTTSGSTTHIYANAGPYTIRVRVQDSEWPVCVSTTATIVPPGPGSNLPPAVGALQFTLSHGTFEEPNKPISFNITVQDPESDAVDVTWSFGDGTSAVHQTVTGTATQQRVTQSHTYTADGTYPMTVTVTDNQVGLLDHTIVQTKSILIETVSKPVPPAATNPLLDIGVPVAIVVIIATAVLAVYLRRRRTMKEEQKREGGGPGPPPPPQ